MSDDQQFVWCIRIAFGAFAVQFVAFVLLVYGMLAG